ncbi:MAG: hypothetical protein HKN03_05940 [Acidimicrobiales bacterium]|nr:hypothetical protein [Acidimicrobiales bacterium]
MRRIVALAFAVAIVSSACSGTGQAGSGPTADSLSAPAVTGSPGADESVGETGGQVVGAAEASRAAAEANQGREFGGEEFGLSSKELVDRSEAVESSIGECMAAAGFEYLPVEFSTIRSAMTSDKSAPGLSNREFIEQYGFGITTQFDKPIVQLSLGEQNQRVIDGLGEADQVAYLRTLFGQHTDATYAFGLETEDFSRVGGCTKTAIEEYFTAAEMSASYFNPGDALIETDPRAQQAIADWADCMADGGIDRYLHPDDVEADFQRRLDALAGDEIPEELTGSDIEALQDEERRVAAVFTRCEDDVLDPVMNRVEAEFYGS